MDAVSAGWAWPMLGKWGAFAAIDVTTVQHTAVATTLMAREAYDNALVCVSPPTSRVMDASLAAIGAARSAFAGLGIAAPIIMGVVNVTPDSFSDGGVFFDAEKAVGRGVALAEAGAAILDIGGESTRPGAVPVSPDEEMRRVAPVVGELANRGLRVSIDTRHAGVMAAAIAAGAVLVNDVTALASDPDSLGVVARSNVAVILMHMQGEPRTMQAAPHYAWAPGDVFDALAARVAACEAAGIPRARIAIDPGIGFGKTEAHSAALFDHLAMFHGLGCVLAVGASRKSFIGRLSCGEPAADRLPGSLAAAPACKVRQVGCRANTTRVGLARHRAKVSIS